MSTRLLYIYINGFRVTKFQLAYISDTTHTSHDYFGSVVLWSKLYVVGKSRVGNKGMGGLYKVE